MLFDARTITTPTLRDAILGLGVTHTWIVGHAAADFTGDGVTDWLIPMSEQVYPHGQPRTGPTPGRLVLLEGRADGSLVDGSWRLPHGGELDALARKVRVADFNGDARPDVVFALNFEDGRPASVPRDISTMQRVLLSNRAGGFDLVPIGFETWGHGLTTGDYNGDGLDDFYVGGFFSATIPGVEGALGLQTAAGGLQTQPVGRYPQSLANLLIDLNDDGRTDFVGTGVMWGNAGALAIELRYQQEDGSLGESVFQELPYLRLQDGVTWSNDPTRFRIVDLNGTEAIDLGYHDASAGDLDHDGQLEVVLFRMGTQMQFVNGVLSENGAQSRLGLDVYEIGADGLLYQRAVEFPDWDASAFFFFHQLIDFDRDGHLDVFVQTVSDDGRPALYLNDGEARFSRVPDALMPTWFRMPGVSAVTSQTGDFNGDGVTDIALGPFSAQGQPFLTSDLIRLFLGTAHIGGGPEFSETPQAPGFNERYYLAEHPDVAQAVARGELPSGLDYYLEIGRAAGHAAFAAGTIVRGSAGDDRIVLREGNEQAFGGPGDDRIEAREGHDAIDGGPGQDTAVYASTRQAFTIEKAGPVFRLRESASGDVDTLTGIEVLEFSDTRIPLVAPDRTAAPERGRDPDFLFDPVFYLLGNPELTPTVTVDTAVDHYRTAGAAQHARPNAWFDAGYYAARWADLQSLAIDDATLFAHYNLHGVWEGRAAAPAFETFDGGRYLADYPDVAAYVDAHLEAFLNSRANGAIAHFLIYGADEQRSAFDLSGVPIDLGYVL